MRTIAANVNQEKGTLNRYFSKCIGAGRAAEVMRHTAYEQLKEIQQECPFDYIRFHGLFHDEMAIAHRDGVGKVQFLSQYMQRTNEGKLQFNFQYVDLLFDALLDIHIRPVVELGLMPETMAEKQTHVFWWKMNKSSAKDINEWYALVESLVRHVTKRYGEEEIKKWYFEVWNEPNLASFFSESKNIDAYFELYDAAARAVKSVCKDYRVGGPAAAGWRWIEEMVAHAREKQVPLDFVSCHFYCAKESFDADGTTQLMLLPVETLINKIRNGGEYCRQQDLPLLVTEWSSSYTSRDAIHDSYINAPFVLEVLKKSEGAVDLLSYWTYTDIFEEVAAPHKMFHGGFGLMTVQSVKKPTYYSYRFLSQLGDTQLVCEDESCFICRSRDEVQLLVWNYAAHDQKGIYNAFYYDQDLPAAKLENTQICLDGLKPDTAYTVTVETVGYKMGDCYGAYQDMGAPQELTREETRELKQRSQPKQAQFAVSADADGKLVFEIPQTENQMDMIRVQM